MPSCPSSSDVVCSACGADRLSGVSLDELVALDAERAGRHRPVRVSIVAKTLAVAGLVLIVCPVIGVLLSWGAMAESGESRAWPYRVGQRGVILRVLLWVGLYARSAIVGR